MDGMLTEQILEALQRRRPRAAFVTEVVSTIQPPPVTGELESALKNLVEQSAVLVFDHSAPDLHLVGVDLRVVATSNDACDEIAASEAADAHWNAWLREFLSTHRCQ